MDDIIIFSLNIVLRILNLWKQFKILIKLLYSKYSLNSRRWVSPKVCVFKTQKLLGKNTILEHFTPIIIKKVISCTKKSYVKKVCFILCLDVGRYKFDNLVCLSCNVFLIFSIVSHI